MSWHESGNPTDGNLRLYSDLAPWWPLFSPPSDYVEEAAELRELLLDASVSGPARTLLELGCGGGSLAYHLKDRFDLTLTDRSSAMLAVSRRVNPECEHVFGDMRTLDLGREFDRVLAHDAIMYATDPEAVRATLRTAARHCRVGGLVAILPDCVRETFEPGTETGGNDGEDGRALRYLEWSWDPDPTDCTFEVAYAILLREPGGNVSVVQDRHRCGCFSRGDWLVWLADAGIGPRIYRDQWGRDVFLGLKQLRHQVQSLNW
jgi:SAM-dependent methyltransferase